MKNTNNDKILIIDFGSQVTQLIARRIRELNVYCEIYAYDTDELTIQKFAPKGIILSGGPNSVYEHNTPKIPDIIFKLNVPLLGICYGMQAIAKQLGGEVESSGKREFGHAEIHDVKSPLLENIAIDNQLQVWMSHGDKVTKLPDGFEIIANNQLCPIAAMADVRRNYYGLQFHPEVTHTKDRVEIFRRFVLNISKCLQSWTMPNYIQLAIEEIKNQVCILKQIQIPWRRQATTLTNSQQEADASGTWQQTWGLNMKEYKVILALSGGVDSSVAAMLIDKAIGKNLVCIFVDNGLLRQNEADQVMQTYKDHMGLNIIRIDAAREFYAQLSGVTDPEQKRKIIGRLFIEIFQREAQKIPDAKFLAQGTIYPDVIESAGGKTQKAHNIKSHHNVGGLPESLHLQLLEPLRELFKDEVRELGLALGLPKHMVFRHPFPGPGLAVRILGEVKPEFVTLLQKADAIFIEELHNSGYYDKVSQAFVVFLPVKSVGVMGDGRTYDYVVSLRAVETSDFMTANVANLPFELITKTANRIINEVKGINRVVYDISGKPPATIEWE